jgi:hypothetical protein
MTGTITSAFLTKPPLETLQKAFEAAEQFLGIAPLLDVEDVVGGRVDEHCVMYVEPLRPFLSALLFPPPLSSPPLSSLSFLPSLLSKNLFSCLELLQCHA